MMAEYTVEDLLDCKHLTPSRNWAENEDYAQCNIFLRAPRPDERALDLYERATVSLKSIFNENYIQEGQYSISGVSQLGDMNYFKVFALNSDVIEKMPDIVTEIEKIPEVDSVGPAIYGQTF